MMDGWNDGMSAGSWILMSVFWIVLLAVIVWAVAQLFPRSAAPQPETPAPENDPQAILDLRLARGEIDPETYDELRAKLDGSRERQPAGGRSG